MINKTITKQKQPTWIEYEAMCHLSIIGFDAQDHL